MLLTAEERKRFIEYCLLQVDSNRALARQLEAIMPQLAKRKAAEAQAYAFVAHDLNNTEEQTIGGAS